MGDLAKFKQVASDVVKMGRQAATEKWGEKGIKDAQDSLRRNAANVRKRSGRDVEDPEPQTSGDRNRAAKDRNENIDEGDDYETPTKKVTARPIPKNEPPKASVRQQAIEGNRRRPEDAETTIVPSGTSSNSPSLKDTSAKIRGRKLIEAATGEKRSEFEARMEREARNMGVQSGAGPAEKAKPLHDLTTEQANDALRGRLRGMDDVEADSDTEKDLVDLLKEHGYESHKKGGKIAARGVGAALRGHGRVIGGKK